jgi:hypothetical protein
VSHEHTTIKFISYLNIPLANLKNSSECQTHLNIFLKTWILRKTKMPQLTGSSCPREGMKREEVEVQNKRPQVELLKAQNLVLKSDPEEWQDKKE